jgi:hypothetical protein
LGVVGGLISLLIVYSVRNRAINPTAASNQSHQLARQLLKPASEALTRYFDATAREAVFRSEAAFASEQLHPTEGHLEVALQTLKETEGLASDKIRDLAPGPFVAIDESAVAIGGLALAKKALRRYNASASGGGHSRLLRAYESRTGQTLALAAECGDAGKLLGDLLDTAIAEIGTVTLFETLSFVRENPVDAERLFAMLEALVTSVRLAVQLKPGLENELDYRFSPANISIGVPGVTGPLASLIQQWFPGASLFESSSAGAIEVFFDHRNLAREHLLLDDLSNEPYNSAPAFLRQALWHFPRRLPALADREGDDNTDVVSFAG